MEMVVSSGKKKVIYTAVMGNYDVIPKPLYVDKECDYILFHDKVTMEKQKENLIGTPWKPVCVERIKGLSSVKMARRIKVMFHEYISGYKTYVWHDANFIQQSSIDNVIRDIHPRIAFTCLSHPWRSCTFDEGKVCKEMSKDNGEVIDPQLRHYQSQGLPENCGMVATGILIRRDTKKVREFSEFWWNEIKKHSHRDQLSVVYSAWQTNQSIKTLDFVWVQNHLKLKTHAKMGND